MIYAIVLEQHIFGQREIIHENLKPISEFFKDNENKKSFKIGKVTVGINEKVFIIAEIGATHNGEIDQVYKLLMLLGQQVLKQLSQTVVPDFSYCSGTLSHDIFSKLSFSIEELYKIKKYCLKKI